MFNGFVFKERHILFLVIILLGMLLFWSVVESGRNYNTAQAVIDAWDVREAFIVEHCDLNLIDYQLDKNNFIFVPSG